MHMFEIGLIEKGHKVKYFQINYETFKNKHDMTLHMSISLKNYFQQTCLNQLQLLH